MKDEKKFQEVVDLTDYERSEELRKAKSRTKKNHSKFTLLCTRQPGNTVSNAVSWLIVRMDLWSKQNKKESTVHTIASKYSDTSIFRFEKVANLKK